ncbi:B-cell scaffold protein with ankyrin repeats-like [Saccostrea echinata]|uniref:B-cell scaffold protein with ankyrin repeats-like n=1 Tax=Saccostrea echinata TaxID=191078 RepID=UPI002A833A7A|nr:B-cell scaffold protein with ankyrin repeats-like [Saccostrea echinata]
MYGAAADTIIELKAFTYTKGGAKYLLISKHENDIVLYFADDGESICDLILASLDKFKYTVRKHNVCIGRPPEESKTFILVLTPEMLEELEIRPKHFLKKIASGSVNQALIHHDVIDIKNNNTRRVLEYQCPDSLTWKCLSTGKNDEEFKMTCFQIFALIDTNFKPFEVPTLVNFKLTPKEIWTAKDDVIITFKKSVNDKNMNVRLRHRCGLSNTLRCLKLNETAYKFNPEGMPEGEILVEVLVDDSSLGKTSFAIRPKMQLLSDLLDDVINPIDFICKTMKTENAEALDLILSEKFSNFKTYRIPLSGLENVTQEENSKIFANASESELPTILHFAAKYGLRRFCETLMRYPGYKAARLIKNKDDRTPSEIALLAGHSALSEQIQNTECASDYEEISK